MMVARLSKPDGAVAHVRRFAAAIGVVGALVLAPAVLTHSAAGAAECNGLAQEAEAATLSGSLVERSDEAANGGAYVIAEPGSNPADADDYLEFCVRVETAGDYRIDARVLAPTNADDSFFVRVGDTPAAIWDVQISTTWITDQVSARGAADPAIYDLGVGDHVVRLSQREDGVAIDSLSLVLVNAAEPGLSEQIAFGGPHVVPGVVQAEDFDLGGPDVAFADSTATNLGSATYRDSSVDIWNTPSAAGYAVGHTRDGEWLEYTITTNAAGTFDFSAAVASGLSDPGSLRLDVNGAAVDTTTIAGTGGWWNFAAVDLGSASLPVGKSVVRITWLATGPDLPKINLDALVIDAVDLGPEPVEQAAFNGPHMAPGVVEAENFDTGGQGVAFNDTTDANIGGAYRDGAVDIWTTVGQPGYTVGHTRDGEWLEYTITADEAGPYDITARVASGLAAPGSLRLDVDGTEVATTPISGTGDWWSFSAVDLGTATLGVGESVLRITWSATGDELPKINLDSLAISVGEPGPEPSEQSPFNGANPVPGVVEAEDFDEGGPGIAFNDTTIENEGGAYRDGPVDIAGTVGGDGFTVGHTRDGEWLEYTVTSESTESYDFVGRVASGYRAPGSLRLDVDGVTISTTAIAGTSDWWDFSEVNLGTHTLGAGDSVVRITWLATRGVTPKINFDSLVVKAASQNLGAQRAFNGPHVLPTVIEAEDFDEGRPGIAFSDTTEENIGGAYRTTPVDIWDTVGEAGYTVGHTRDGEWLEYTVVAENAGSFDFAARLATGLASPGSLRLSVDGETVAETLISSSGGWWNFAEVDLGSVVLDRGESVVRITWLATNADVPKINLDSLLVSSGGDGGLECSGPEAEAETGVLQGDIRITADDGASGGAYIEMGQRLSPADWAPAYLDLCLEVPVGGVYRLEAFLDGLVSTSFNGTYPRNNSGSALATPSRIRDNLSLDAGAYRVRFIEREYREVRLDRVRLVRSTPAGDAVCGDGERSATEARLAGRFGPVLLGSDSAVVPRRSGGASSPGDSYVEFCATVATAGTYRIDADVMTPTREKNSFFVSVDDGPAVTFTADIATTRTTQQVEDNAPFGLTPRGTVAVSDTNSNVATWDLEPGEHLIRFYLHHDGVELYNIELVPATERLCTIDGRLVPTRLDQASCDAALDLLETFLGDQPNLRPIGDDPCGWAILSIYGGRGVTCSPTGEAIVGFRTPQFQCATARSIPESIGDLQTLEQLDLSRACLDSIPAEIANLTNLQTLDLSSNELTDVPASIANLTNLQTLDLSSNELTAVSSFGPLPNLQSLRLGLNRLRGDITAIAGLAQAIEPGSLSDYFAGNDCLTTTDSTFAAVLDTVDRNWSLCEYPIAPAEVVDGYRYVFFNGPPGPSSRYLNVTRLDDQRRVAGNYISGYPSSREVDIDGFVRELDGSLTLKDFRIAAINDRGDLAGYVGRYSYTPVLELDGVSVPLDVDDLVLDGDSATATAINERGDIVGTVDCCPIDPAGFLRFADGTVITIAVPEARRVEVTAINDLGHVAGTATDGDNTRRGFIRTADGSLTVFDAPDGGDVTSIASLNEAGVVAGTFRDANGLHGFIRSADGSVISFDMAGGIDTTVAEMNDRGDIVGTFEGADGIDRSYLRTADGSFAEVDAGTGGIFRAKAINNNGDIAGTVGLLGFLAERVVD